MKRNKIRIDALLVNKGLAPNRSRARAYIMAGIIKAGGKPVDKPGQCFTEDVEVEIIKPPHPYVGRGGLKIEKGLDHFDIDVKGKVCLDAGASTGGFTHCLLLRGAMKVYAADVGYGQLDYKLRTDERVVVLEKCNVRYLSNEHVPEKVDVITADLSFISLRLVIPKLLEFLKPCGVLMPLIKPQFEAERGKAKKGVVRDRAVRDEVVEGIVDFATDLGLKYEGVVESPITGPKGNVEFVACFRLQEAQGREKAFPG